MIDSFNESVEPETLRNKLEKIKINTQKTIKVKNQSELPPSTDIPKVMKNQKTIMITEDKKN